MFLLERMPRAAKISKTDINVLPCKLANKPDYKFVVTGPQAGGRRWRKFFASRGQAEAFAHLQRVDLSNHGMKGAALSQTGRAEYLDCIAKLAPFKIGLREAVEILLPSLVARNQTVEVSKAVKTMLDVQTRDGASRRHVEDLRSRLGQFTRAFEERTLVSFNAPEIDIWLRSLPVANLTRNNFRRVVSGLFAFGLVRGWCVENPVAKLSKAKVPAGKVGILTPEQTARLLVNAPVDTVAPLAIAAFCGLRRAELERLDWREVHLAKGLIEVAADKAKTARRRFIPIRENLAAWLASYARATGPVCPINWRVHFDKARELAKLDGAAWPDNGLRHSFASYHAARFQDAGKLAAEMGHTTPTVVFQHYRELVEPDTAARYWNILPDEGTANIIPLLVGNHVTS